MKPLLFAAMASVLAVMWINRDLVTEAYTDPEAPVEIRFGGVDLDFEKTELPASPYVVHIGEDTRRRPMSLLFTEVADDVEVEMVGGTARIEGSVTVDGRPASGGTVRLERHTRSGVGVRDLSVNTAGRYGASDLPGGRYRVRAWLPGTGTMTTSDLFFADADSTVTRNYRLEPIEPDPLIEFVDGGTMYAGMTGSFGVSVTQQRVDNDGIIVTRPLAGAYVTGRFPSHLELLSPATQATGGDGQVLFRLRCRRPGSGSVSIRFEQRFIPVNLPPCLRVPPTTTPTIPPPTSITPARPGGSGDQGRPTTTTRPSTATSRAPGSTGGSSSGGGSGIGSGQGSTGGGGNG